MLGSMLTCFWLLAPIETRKGGEEKTTRAEPNAVGRRCQRWLDEVPSQTKVMEC